jgi:hypothetical protein
MMVRVSECNLNFQSKYSVEIHEHSDPYPAWMFEGAIMVYWAKLYFKDLLHKKQGYTNAGTCGTLNLLTYIHIWTLNI